MHACDSNNNNNYNIFIKSVSFRCSRKDRPLSVGEVLARSEVRRGQGECAGALRVLRGHKMPR